MKLTVTWIVIALAIASGCSTHPALEDRVPDLKADQGIAALAFHQAYGVSELVLLQQSGGGQTLYVPSIADGDSVVLIPADVGRYCLHQYHIGAYFFTSEHDDQCFEVQPGKVSYAGLYEPYQTLSMNPGPALQKTKGMVSMNDFQGFLRLLRESYPHIAAQSFPATKDVPARGICSLLGDQLAAKLLGATVGSGVESEQDQIPECTFSDSLGNEAKYSFLREKDPEAQFDSLTRDDVASGWTNWTTLNNYGLPLGRKLKVSMKSEATKMAVLLRDRVLILTVSGIGGRYQDAMINAARSIVAGCQVAELTFQSCAYQAD